MPIHDRFSSRYWEEKPLRFSVAWYEQVIPMVQEAVQEAEETERFYRLIGRPAQAELYGDLADSRRAFLDSILERTVSAAHDENTPDLRLSWSRVGDRQPKVNGGSFSDTGFDLDASANESGPLFHAE
jgi:hypothetical protein